MKFDGSFPAFAQGPLLSTYDENQIKNEPMLFGADIDFAIKNGGPITYDFICKFTNSLTKKEREKVIIDSKVCMLMKGWYPCIPGWHHDDVARTRSDGQPNYEELPLKPVQHAMAICEDTYKGPGSRTQFLCGTIDLKIPPKGKVIYKEWNDQINEILDHRRKYQHIPVWTSYLGLNQIHWFTSNVFHRGMPADRSGWRFFIRASWNTKRKVTNEIRKQSQIYMSALEAGW